MRTNTYPHSHSPLCSRICTYFIVIQRGIVTERTDRCQFHKAIILTTFNKFVIFMPFQRKKKSGKPCLLFSSSISPLPSSNPYLYCHLVLCLVIKDLELQSSPGNPSTLQENTVSIEIAQKTDLIKAESEL